MAHYIDFTPDPYDQPSDADYDEYVGSCPACGNPIDYCQGHGEMGDPHGHTVLAEHDVGVHVNCHPDGCEEIGAVK